MRHLFGGGGTGVSPVLDGARTKCPGHPAAILLVFPFLCLCLTVSAAASPAPAPLVLDDSPELLAPRRPRTEADRNHIEALALWATGRTHQQNKEYAKALRCYQRALRFDPRSAEIVQAIIPIADRLNRHAVAARYALIDVELNDADPMLLRRLAVFLAGKGDWTSAAALYEKAVAVRKNAKQSAADVFLRMEMGRLYLLMEKYERAAECFAHVVNAVEHPDEFALDVHLSRALLDDPGRTYQLMGECFLTADRPEDARAAFQKVEQHSPDSAMRQYNLARVNAQTDKPAEALEALEACFAGQGTAPYKTLADVLKKLGKKDELIGRLEKLHAAEPNNLPLGYFLAARLRDAGKTDRAESLYRKLLDGKPMPTGYRELADILRRAKRFDALLSVLGESVEKIGVLNTLGSEEQTISGDGESLRGLVDAARKSIGKTPEGSAFCKALAVALLALEAKRFETAGEFFGLALEADPQRADEALMLWGVGLLSGDRAAEAVVVFRRAIDQTALPSGGPAFHFYLAGALALEGRSEEALAAARIAAEKNKSSARYRGRAAWVFYYCRRHDEAMDAYRELIDEFDADHAFAETREVLREARMALSNLAVIKGDKPQAEEWLEQVLDEFPDDLGAMNDLGYLWADQGRNLRRAERMIRRAVAAEPEKMAYRDSLGWVLYRTQKYSEAVTELEKAAADKPDGVVLDHLGDSYLKTGQRDKAVAAWRKAAEEFRKEKDTEQAETVEQKLLTIEN